jgi:hypothetical protein
MASIAEMSGPKTEEHSNGATVAALVLQKVRAMLRTHLGSGNITASPTYQLCWVILLSHFCITACLSSIIRLKHCTFLYLTTNTIIYVRFLLIHHHFCNREFISTASDL